MRVRLLSGLRVTAAALFAVVALVSVLEFYVPTWNFMYSERITWDDVPALERARAPARELGLPPDLFEFYRDRLRRGDRYYFHVIQEPYGTADLPTTVKAYGRYFFLPAILVDDPQEATVVLGWRLNPNDLGLPYESFEQAGDQPHYVARVDLDR
jgi:hypothetical protein